MEQDQLLDNAKSFFYYPSGIDLIGSVAAILQAIPSQEQKAFTSSLFQELYYEQEQRRLYILNGLGLGQLDRDTSEILIRKIYTEKESALQTVVQSVLPTVNFDPSFVLSDELVKQIEIFSTVNASITNYFVDQIANNKVAKLYRIVKDLDLASKTKLHTDIDSFIVEIGRAFDSRGLEGTNVSKAIEAWIQKLGLNTTYSKLESLGEKVSFLNLIDEIITRQLADPASNPDDAEAIHDVALIDYYQNPPQILNFA